MHRYGPYSQRRILNLVPRGTLCREEPCTAGNLVPRGTLYQGCILVTRVLHHLQYDAWV